MPETTNKLFFIAHQCIIWLHNLSIVKTSQHQLFTVNLYTVLSELLVCMSSLPGESTQEIIPDVADFLVLLIGASKQKLRFQHFQDAQFVQSIFSHFIYNSDFALHYKGLRMIQKALDIFPDEVTHMILDLQDSVRN